MTDEIDEKKRRRAQALLRQEQQRQRNAYGPELVHIIGESLGAPLELKDFSQNFQVAEELIWPADIRLAPGLVHAYMSREDAASLLNCIQNVLGPLDGYIGFHEKAYLGYANVSGVRFPALLGIAEKAEAPVLFYLHDSAGVILTDYYRSPVNLGYSVVAQGTDIVRRLRYCFAKK